MRKTLHLKNGGARYRALLAEYFDVNQPNLADIHEAISIQKQKELSHENAVKHDAQLCSRPSSQHSSISVSLPVEPQD